MTNITIEDHIWHIILNANANEKKSALHWQEVEMVSGTKCTE